MRWGQLSRIRQGILANKRRTRSLDVALGWERRAERLEVRQMLDGEIHGTVWHDLDSDGVLEGSEPRVANWTVYLDLNQNGVPEFGEPSQLTDVNGDYAFTGLAPGNYHVTQVMQLGWSLTSPLPGPQLTYLANYKDNVGSINGLNGAEEIITSPDGKNIYVVSILENALVWFDRDPVSGLLTYRNALIDGIAGVDGLRAAHWVTMSSDGKWIYTAARGDDAIGLFSRNTTTGAISYVTTFQDGVNGVDGLDGVGVIELSPDENFLYSAGRFEDAVSVFSRNPVTGLLTFQAVYRDGVDGVDGLDEARAITLSEDGNHVYVAALVDSSVTLFTRNQSTGLLTYEQTWFDGVGGVDGLDNAISVKISPDGNHVYALGTVDDAIAHFTRNPTTGMLTYVASYFDGVGGNNGLDGAIAQTFSDDGRHYYVAGFNDNTLTAFNRDVNTGALTLATAYTDGAGGIDGLGGVHAVVLSPDEKFLYVGSFNDDAVAVFRREKPVHIVTIVGNEVVTGKDFGVRNPSLSNGAPVLDPIGNQVVNEAALLTFTASASDPDLDSLVYSLGPGAPAGASIDPDTGVFTWTPGDNFVGPVSITIIVTDNGVPAMNDSETIQVTVNNVAPTADAGVPYAIDEGTGLALLGSGSDPAGVNDPLLFSWDLNGDLVFGDATGVAPSLTWAQLLSLGIDDGVYTVRLRVDDGDGGITTSAPTTLTINNLPPTLADAGGPYVINEGDGLSLAGFGSDPVDTLSFSWDLNGDLVFGDATGANPTLSPAQLAALGLSDGPGVFAVRLRVDDGDGGVVDSAPTTLTIDNLAPTAAIAAAFATQFRGESVTYTLTATDPASADQAGAFTWDIDWDNNGVWDQSVSGPVGTTVTHSYPTTGTKTIAVRATDDDGGTGGSSTTNVTVNKQVARFNGSTTDLLWGGTPGFDGVFFIGAGTSITVFTQFENSVLNYSNVLMSGINGRIKAYGYDSLDVLDAEFIGQRIVELYGGNGDDALYGGNRGDSLYGGQGNDLLVGGTQGTDQGDRLFGEDGLDVLFGYKGADTLD
ncbi:MAG: beta-propeller fold lactonase family protein, partial [Pirellulales bacterium]|nr:beta-propeller fold lactonase family protein [Pirellulales bacterium]